MLALIARSAAAISSRSAWRLSMAILRRDCPHCPAEHVAFQLRWNEPVPRGLAHRFNCVAICGACGKPICFQATYKTSGTSTKPLSIDGDIEPAFTVGNTWPSRTPSTAPPHTPTSVRNRFIEGENAYARHSWNAAVAMYRSALDIASKGMDGVPRGTFYQRLQWLHENHRITPEIRSWADHVRVEGNEALHDPDDFEEEDARPLRLFTEMFLRYVFELPGEVQAFRQQGEAAEEAEVAE